MPRLSALDYALKLLGYRARTKREIEQKLTEKDYSTEDVEKVLDKLSGTQLLDDSKFAANYVRDKLTIGRRGPRRIYFELVKHGVDKDVADAATKTIDADEEQIVANQLIEARSRQWTKLEPLARYRRAIGLLSRRGFSPSVISHTLKDWTKY